MNDDLKKDFELSTYRLLQVVLILIILTITGYSLLAIINGWILAKTPEELGVFGDFLGGVLNPIIAFASILILYKVYMLQKKELRDAHKTFTEMYKQNESDIKKKEIKAIIHSFENRIDLVLKKIVILEPNSPAYRAFQQSENPDIRRTNFEFLINNFDENYDYKIFESGNDFSSLDIIENCKQLISLFSDLRFYLKLYELEMNGSLYSDYIRGRYSNLIFTINLILNDKVSKLIYDDFALAGDRSINKDRFNKK